MRHLPSIGEWTELDVEAIATGESDGLEFKSGMVPLDDLKNKISVAASAFWNSGGGVFIAGVDNSGRIDGGIPRAKGRQNIRDWIDNAIKLTEPVADYDIRIIEPSCPSSKIEDGRVIAVILFRESNMVPHMAYDKRYYIRSGAHTDPAGHFLVESLRALRGFIKPNLRGIMKYHPSKPNIEQLVIIAINDAVALDVQLSFDPLPKMFHENFPDAFPLVIPAIDRQNPFSMDVSGFGIRDYAFGEHAVNLILQYEDTLGNNYTTVQEIHPEKNLQPMSIGVDVFKELVKAIEKLATNIR